ncbi:uncharacterized protein SPSK_01491 [Sporothrix schenckii 1099-18]|uniref:Zn(2)-C6 fungal-type domain-containing protein n=1 Tax=Sporothrix schenckii 1099-18 TaxID=1397361 RepID=A0A0F2MGB3_SPOSC|nr:uncharacterized protein SPSK_01491 [Sporothrix schenckii 1099-18]KJR87206.1 hypothetical protein SPSK_01491 [Sporothrix schenckii 1099-18]
MTSRIPRSSAGCWTCRLRRKKCDEARPVCEGCAALEIECLYSESRPNWMDNGPRQRAMADRLKLSVKDRAAWRREKRFLRDIETGAAAIRLREADDDVAAGASGRGGDATHMFSVASFATPVARPASPPATASTASPSDSSGAEHAPTAATATTATTAPSSSQIPPNGTSSDGTSADWTTPASLDPPNLDREHELNLMMLYLDFVFPFLYPFCRPTMLGSGRGWLLVLLMKNKAVFHSALSLSSYFMAVVTNTTHALSMQATPEPISISTSTLPASGGGIDLVDHASNAPGEHGSCLMVMASELHKQQELSLRELQRTIAAVSVAPPTAGIGSESHLAESARALESILQLLSFEGVLQRFDRWHVHLDAAVTLFEQIMQQYGGGQEGAGAGASTSAPSTSTSSPSPTPTGWPGIIARLSPLPANVAAQTMSLPLPYGSDQAALTFYASVLLYMDIVTSTVTETAPRLQQYHASLLGSCEEGTDGRCGDYTVFKLFDSTKNSQLAAHEVVGIRNWVLLALAKAAALAAWKKEAAAARRLTVAELLARAAPIERKGDPTSTSTTPTAGQAGEPSLPAGFYSRYIAAAEAQLVEALSAREEACRDRENDPHHHYSHGRQDDPSLPPHSAHAHYHDSAAVLSVDTATYIWGLAVLTYLKVVVNGWQPAADDVRQSADALLRELAALPSASCLRLFAWPLCVAGCLAACPQQRALYPGMVSEICSGELYGTVNEALRIMRAVWAAQDLQALGGRSGEAHVHVEWDFARCFNILGRRAYLF